MTLSYVEVRHLSHLNTPETGHILLPKDMAEGVLQYRATIRMSEHQAIFCYGNIGDCYNDCHESAPPGEAQ